MSTVISNPVINDIGAPHAVSTGGRKLNSVSEIYKIAADDEEWNRLTLQHRIFKILLGANYVGPVQEVLADDGSPKAVLDLGCGSGAWARDMAEDFPNSRVIGIDLAPDVTRPSPANCSFEVGNLNDGLDQYENQFNLIATRLIVWGVKDYQGMINQIGKALRPKGMIHLIEWGLEVYDAEKQLIDSAKHPEASGFGTWLYHLSQAAKARGGSVYADQHLERWVREDENFEDVHLEHVFVPDMPSFSSDDPDHERLNKLGAMARESHKSFISGSRPLLEAHGLSADTIDKLANAALEEEQACRNHIYMRTTIVWARKKAI